MEENVAAALELEAVGKDEKSFAEVENILKPIKNQTWPSGIQKTWNCLQAVFIGLLANIPQLQLFHNTKYTLEFRKAVSEFSVKFHWSEQNCQLSLQIM